MRRPAEERFNPDARAAIAAAGWTVEPSVARIMGRTWAILTRPHRAGGQIRLMLDVSGTASHALSHDLPQWSAHFEAQPHAVDFPGFAGAIEKELNALHIHHHGWMVMGIYGAGITDMVTFEVKAAENDAPADVVANVSCMLDPAAAAATVATGLRKTWDEVSAFDTLQAADPLVERSAVVAASAVAEDADQAIAMLRVRPPIRVVTRFEVTSDQARGPAVSYKDMPSERWFDGDTRRRRRDDESRMVRTPRGVTARVASGRMRWNGNTLMPVNVDEFPDAVLMALAGRPVDEVIDQAVLRGSGLVVERAWMSPGSKRRFLRIAVRSDLMSLADARTLAERLVGQERAWFRETHGGTLPLSPRFEEEEE